LIRHRQHDGGGNGQRTLVLVDGRRTNGVVSGATDWASIPLDDIERIEVVRGPAATLYGDPALAGAINIITRKGKGDHKWRTRIAAGSGVSVTELNTMLNKFTQMQQMMKKMGKFQKMMARMGGGMPGMLPTPLLRSPLVSNWSGVSEKSRRVRRRIPARSGIPP
jgi:outer membrane receptor for Fe3+-dicitrate